MPEADETVPADAGRAFSWRTASAARDSPAADDGKPIPPGREEAGGSAAGSDGEAAEDDQFRARAATQVLADRLAMEVVHHEPGWRLPRHTVLARRYNVSTAQIDAAISELVGRHLIRRLPDGQVHRVSPVEYLIPLEGVPGLRSRIDPMTGEPDLPEPSDFLAPGARGYRLGAACRPGRAGVCRARGLGSGR